MSGLALTAEQQALVDLLAGAGIPPRLVCLTGGPGVGKTFTIASLLDALQAQGRSCILAAPSGKAAQRLEEATGRPAQTIHRLLRLRPESTQHEPLTASVVVVDEASMIDTLLFAQLVRACFEGGGRVQSLLLVGDPDQLPPVGPGQPFHDLLQAERVQVPVVRLTQVQRQAQDSGIVRAAYAIRAGRAPEWAPDFRLVQTDDAAGVPGAVWGVIRDLGLDPGDSQVLAPQRTHSAGVEALNAHIEEVRGSQGPLVRRRFRAGTKVIHCKNDYDLNVFNGELGFVERAQPGERESQDVLDVAIAGDVKRYRGAAIKLLQPAWALTVHKSQGSEWRTVVVVAHSQHAYMLSRSLLYVATTRARERVVVVGEASAVAKAVRRVEDSRRRTLLQRWLGRRAS